MPPLAMMERSVPRAITVRLVFVTEKILLAMMTTYVPLTVVILTMDPANTTIMPYLVTITKTVQKTTFALWVTVMELRTSATITTRVLTIIATLQKDVLTTIIPPLVMMETSVQKITTAKTALAVVELRSFATIITSVPPILVILLRAASM